MVRNYRQNNIWFNDAIPDREMEECEQSGTPNKYVYINRVYFPNENRLTFKNREHSDR